MKKWLPLLFFLAIPAWAADSPSVKLRVEASPREITIGDPIHMRIIVLFSEGLAPSPLEVVRSTGDFELVSYTPPLPQRKDNATQEMIHDLYLTTFSTGTLLIPPFTLRFQTPNKQMAETATEPVEIKVNSLLEKHGDEGALRPLKGLFNVRSFLWLWILLGILSLILIGYCGWRALSRKTTALVSARPARPPEENAWEALHKLEDSDLLEQGLVKEYYSRLSLILRTYLEERYSISCLERTTAELFVDFRSLPLSTEQTALLKIFFENGDLVKFAKFTPDPSDIEADLNRVKHFINETTPAQAPAPVPEEAPV